MSRGYNNLNETKNVKRKEKKSKAKQAYDDFFDPEVLKKIDKEKKTFSLDERIVSALRIYAASKDETLSHVVERALKEYISEEYFK
jgi:uncharacterized protein YciW